MMGRASTGGTAGATTLGGKRATSGKLSCGYGRLHGSRSEDRRHGPRARLRFPAFVHFFLFDLVAFARGEKQVGFKTVLAGVEVVVAAALCK